MNSRLKKFFFNKKRFFSGILLGAAVIAALVPVVVAFAANPYVGVVPFGPGDTSGLRLDGSTTVYPIAAAALGIQGIGGTYTSGPFQNAGHTGLQAHVEQGGSGQGKGDAQGLWVDIGDASSITDLGTYPNLHATKIARDGICAIINGNGNSLTDISMDQLKRIYNAYITISSNIVLNDGNTVGSGITTDAKGHTVTSSTQNAQQVNGVWVLPPITNWNQIPGGPNQPIVAVGRIIGSGTRDALADFLNLDKNNSEIATNTQEGPHRIDSNGDLAAYITNNQWTIGYVGIGYAASLPSTVTTLTVGGVKATAQNVCTVNAAKLYPMSRYLYMCESDQYATDPQTNANRSNADAFIAWMRTAAGQAIVAQQNFISLTPLADINQDGAINVLDLGKLGKKWNFATAAYQAANSGHYSGTLTAGDPADINGDGVVNVLDLGKLGKWWNITYSNASNAGQGTTLSLDTLTPDYPNS